MEAKENSSNNKVAIIVALITVIGTLLGTIITNWNNLFQRQLNKPFNNSLNNDSIESSKKQVTYNNKSDSSSTLSRSVIIDTTQQISIIKGIKKSSLKKFDNNINQEKVTTKQAYSGEQDTIANNFEINFCSAYSLKKTPDLNNDCSATVKIIRIKNGFFKASYTFTNVQVAMGGSSDTTYTINGTIDVTFRPSTAKAYNYLFDGSDLYDKTFSQNINLSIKYNLNIDVTKIWIYILRVGFNNGKNSVDIMIAHLTNPPTYLYQHLAKYINLGFE